jgi:hypothetical protein
MRAKYIITNYVREIIKKFHVASSQLVIGSHRLFCGFCFFLFVDILDNVPVGHTETSTDFIEDGH